MTREDSYLNDNSYADVLKQISQLEGESVQVIFTCPPIIQRALLKMQDFKDRYQRDLVSLDEVWKECKRVLKDSGSMWIACDNYFYDEQLVRLPFELGRRIQGCGFLFRNVIIWYNLQAERLSRNLVNRYSCILFFTKSKNYRFDLDQVREPHIWKDVEWGGGRRSRYNPRGKDPSNFWLRTEGERGKTLRHIPLTLEDVIARCLLVSSDVNDAVLDIFAENSTTQEIARKLNRIPKACFSQVSYSRELSTSTIEKNRVIMEAKSNPGFGGRIYLKSSEAMDEVSDSSVQLVITSPPYWGLRDYGVGKQIGYGESYEEYLSRLGKVWKECFRVLFSTGSLWININKRIIDGNILLFPEDITRVVLETGFCLKDIVVWHKPVFVPTTGPKNFTDRHEYVLFFTKSYDNYLFKHYEPEKPDYLHPGNEKLANVWKIHRRIGNIGKQISVMINEREIKHTAVYPNELVRRIILLCSNKGDLVLDPFAGSGTTLVVANFLGRQWIGYELNPDYRAIIEWRLKNEAESLLAWV